MIDDSSEEYVTCADCAEHKGKQGNGTVQKPSLRVNGVLNCLKSVGISALCIGDSSTIILTHQLREALGKLACDRFEGLHLLWIRRVEIEPGRGFCSIEPLISSETCGFNSTSPDLRCGLCKKCLIIPSTLVNPCTNRAGFAFAGVACLVTFHPEVPLSSGNLRSHIIFCMSAIRKPAIQPSLSCSSEDSVLLLKTYIPGLEQLCGGCSDVFSPDSGTSNSEKDSIITQELLCMLECVSKESLNTSLDEFKGQRDTCLGASRKQMYPGFIHEVEAELDSRRMCSAVLAVNFGDASDFCLYEINFACALNYL